jgi:hypothetical protein
MVGLLLPSFVSAQNTKPLASSLTHWGNWGLALRISVMVAFFWPCRGR